MVFWPVSFSFATATFCPFETRLSLFNSCLFERLIFCQSVSSFVTICSNLFETWANCRISSTLEKDRIRQIISSGISPKWHCFFDLMTYDWKCHMYSEFKIKKNRKNYETSKTDVCFWVINNLILIIKYVIAYLVKMSSGSLIT